MQKQVLLRYDGFFLIVFSVIHENDAEYVRNFSG